MNYSFIQLAKFWDALGDIPINNEEEIDEAIMFDDITFEAGTCRYYIWEWFDEHLSKVGSSLAKLMKLE